jgi:aspartyl-tRNA(Asn)/glutamyl-tRNA(Gln) amidotransferase subunit A
VAAGFGHFSLCSDTNGSIRVPSSFCGVFGLKPTFGRLSRAGSAPFVPSLDHLGPLARSAFDLALVHDALQGPDPDDHACAQRPVEPVASTLCRGVQGLRIGVLGGYFEHWADPDARAAVARAAAALGAVGALEWPAVDAARAGAFVITASEAGALYLPAQRTRAQDFEPHTRERLMAGALLPSAWYVRAQRFRRWFADEVGRLFEHVDVLLAPATPRVATPIGSEEMTLNGQVLATRPNIGLLTQPVSFIGLPVAVAPVATATGLPIGVQMIAPPWKEGWCLRAAWALERSGVAAAPVADWNAFARESS